MSAARSEIVRYHPGLKPGLLELQRHHWGANDALNANYFEWKYEANPYLKEPYLYLALHHGKAIAMRGFQGGRWEAGTPAAAELVLSAGDLVVVPEHRGRGLFTRLMDAALADLASTRISYLFGLSASVVTRLASLASGWGSPGPLARMGREDRPTLWTRLRRAARRAPGLRALAGQPFRQLDRYLASPPGWLRNGITVSSTPRPEAMADLIRRLGHDGRIRHVRDTTYLAWRFHNPRSAYRFCFLERERLEAYLVLQARACSANHPVVRVVDWEGESAEARSAVVQAALGDLYEGPAEASAVFFPPTDQATLRAVGFAAREVRSAAEYQATVLVRPVAAAGTQRPWLFNGRDLLDLANWDLRQLYSDGA